MFKVFKTPEFKKAISFFVEGIKENKKSFYISNISALLWCFLVIIQPYLIKRIIDDGIVAENQRAVIVFILLWLLQDIQEQFQLVQEDILAWMFPSM